MPSDEVARRIAAENMMAREKTELRHRATSCFLKNERNLLDMSSK